MSGTRVLRPLIARSTWRRWAYLVAGGALLLPYWILGMIVVAQLFHSENSQAAFPIGLLALLLPIPAVFVTGLVPAVRVLEGTAVKELVGGGIAQETIGAARSWVARLRTACWYSGHLWLGMLVSILSLAVPSGAIALALLPLWGAPADRNLYGRWAWIWDERWAQIAGPVGGVLLTVGLVYLFAGCGALLARLAPVFLGPTPAERLTVLEERATRLAERNRLARELHDSVGHALSVVTLQAGAAGRVLDSDPAFARQALGAIEETARSALEDLDHVLGLLREDATSKAPQPTLTDLAALLDQTRLAGVELEAHIDGDLTHVPAAVSREAYRIVQEGLTNALRHAGRVPVVLRLAVRADLLEVEMSNPIAAAPDPVRPARGGRGLRGIRERVTVLRGHMSAGPDGQSWRIGVSLPLRSVP
ncbi:sensor histidine kinase [Actinomadura alba]|uniref:sensor histidine kinase n=1 Tax=Actinomadura alba TaxID=406431 RepID=UPI0028A5D31B|nr:histidine kinase [Actinomadura alba]